MISKRFACSRYPGCSKPDTTNRYNDLLYTFIKDTKRHKNDGRSNFIANTIPTQSYSHAEFKNSSRASSHSFAPMTGARRASHATHKQRRTRAAKGRAQFVAQLKKSEAMDVSARALDSDRSLTRGAVVAPSPLVAQGIDRKLCKRRACGAYVRARNAMQFQPRCVWRLQVRLTNGEDCVTCACAPLTRCSPGNTTDGGGFPRSDANFVIVEAKRRDTCAREKTASLVARSSPRRV